MSDDNRYAAPKARVSDVPLSDPPASASTRVAAAWAALAFVLAVVALAAICTGVYGWYSHYTTLLEFENAATVVALVCCGVGVTLWGPSFSHGGRLSQDGYMPTPATGNPRNQLRGIFLLCGGLAFLGLVVLAHYALS